MENAAFFLEELNCHELHNTLNSTRSLQSVDGGISCGIDSIYPNCAPYHGNLWQQPSSFWNHEMSPEFGTLSPQLQVREIYNGIQEFEDKEENKQPFSLSSFELLRSYGDGLKLFKGDGISCQELLSTEEIIRIAGARFVQSSSHQTVNVESILISPFTLSSIGISHEDAQKVQLAELLLATAEKIDNEQFGSARRLLRACESLSSNTGNPVQRLVYYFSEALRERLDIKTGKITLKELERKDSFDIIDATMTANPVFLAYHQQVPFGQILHFAGIQAILDNVVGAAKIHMIDFVVRSGTQWAVLMEALVNQFESPLELLKITAIGSTSKQEIEETGKRLTSFAQAMNIPFSFKIVMVSEMLDLEKDLFELDPDEAVAVYCRYSLGCLVAMPNKLETVMRVIKEINPCIMVVTEIEANQNSPTFVGRFTEALFYFSAFFDCLETSMEGNDPNRDVFESMFFREAIRNILVTDKEGRKVRNVKIDVWRAFFTRSGMEEIELSESSLLQANLVAKKFTCGKYCTIDMDRRSLIIGWKGTPLHSLSAWRFISQEQEDMEDDEISESKPV